MPDFTAAGATADDLPAPTEGLVLTILARTDTDTDADAGAGA
ncbi:hypothetical protein [Streptomyces collinus]